MGDRPAARRKRRGAAGRNRLGAARIPDIEEDDRRSPNMQRPETLGLTPLIRHAAIARHGWLISIHRSALPGGDGGSMGLLELPRAVLAADLDGLAADLHLDEIGIELAVASGAGSLRHDIALRERPIFGRRQ